MTALAALMALGWVALMALVAVVTVLDDRAAEHEEQTTLCVWCRRPTRSATPAAVCERVECRLAEYRWSTSRARLRRAGGRRR